LPITEPVLHSPELKILGLADKHYIRRGNVVYGDTVVMISRETAGKRNPSDTPDLAKELFPSLGLIGATSAHRILLLK
jgi:hypothetical protein